MIDGFVRELVKGYIIGYSIMLFSIGLWNVFYPKFRYNRQEEKRQSKYYTLRIFLKALFTIPLMVYIGSMFIFVYAALRVFLNLRDVLFAKEKKAEYKEHKEHVEALDKYSPNIKFIIVQIAGAINCSLGVYFILYCLK